MAPPVHRDKSGFQQQYGTLWRAAEVYLDGRMPDAHAAAFENVVDPAFLAAVASARMLQQLVNTYK